MKASACHHTLHANHWHCLWNISPIIAVKSNVTTSIKVLRFVVNMFIVVGLRLPYLNTPILKAWGSASRAQRPLTTGIVRRQFPSLRGTTWRNNGRSAWNGSRFKHICAFYAKIINIHGVQLKMSCYNRACANSTSNPSGYALGIWLLVSHAPSCIGRTNPSRTGLNPLI